MDIGFYVKIWKKRYVVLNWYLSEISDRYWLLYEKSKEKICNIELYPSEISNGYHLLYEKIEEEMCMALK
jgi:hypothetical protein